MKKKTCSLIGFVVTCFVIVGVSLEAWGQTACWTNLVTSSAQSWDNNANWTNVAAFPNANGAVVVITNAIAANQTINLNQAITNGSLTLGAGNRFSIASGSGGSLTFRNNGSLAVLLERAGSQGDTISSDISLADSLIISNNASGKTLSLSGTISDAGIGKGISLNGPGSTVFSGTNMLAVLTNRTGTVVLDGAFMSNHLVTVVGAVAGTATLVVSNGAQFICTNALALGSVSGATGIVNQSGGTVTLSSSGKSIWFGGALSGTCVGEVGVYNLSGGTLTFNGTWLGVGYNGSIGVFNQSGGLFNNIYKVDVPRQGGHGFFNLSGGIMTNSIGNNPIIELGALAGSAATYGLYYQSGGTNIGTANGEYLSVGQLGTNVAYISGGLFSLGVNSTIRLGNGTTTDSRDEMTVAGGTVSVNAGSGIVGLSYAQGVGAGGVNVFNLNGGLLQCKALYKVTSASLGIVNFNGGTNQIGASGIMMGPGVVASSGFTNALDAAYVQSGGAVIDTQGYTVTNAQNLLAPTLSGITALPFPGSIGGYVAAPYVQLSGGDGTGATAVALIDLGSGSVTGLVLASAGSGFTVAPTVTLIGGGIASTNLGTATIGSVPGGGLVKLGSGTLVLTGTNTYTGDTVIPAGTLVVGNPLSLQGSTLNYTNGTVKFDASATAYTLGGLAGNQDLGLTNNAGTALTLTVGGNGHSTTYSGVLSKGGASLIKMGTGTLTLSGNNTYTGGTTVSNGTLLVNGSITGAVTMAGGSLGGGGAVSGSVTFASASTITPAITNGSGGATCLTVAGPLDITGASLVIQDSSHYLASPSSVMPYKIVACQPNGLSGSFATVTGLTNGWYVAYDRVAGQITLRFHNGTLIEIQ